MTELKIILDNEIIQQIEDNKEYRNNEKYNIDYFSIRSDLITDFNFIRKVLKFGAHYFLFHCFLKAQMLNGGRYYIFEGDIDLIIKNYCLNYDASYKDIKEIYNDYIKNQIIFVLEDKRFFEERIVTDPYIVYNYCLTNDKRAYNRIKKQEQREREKAEKAAAQNAPAAPSAPNFPVNDIGEDL